MVTIYDLETAREWLEANEGPDGEHESCRRVADFIAREIQKRINDSAARSAAKAHGIPLRVAKAAVRRATAATEGI